MAPSRTILAFAAALSLAACAADEAAAPESPAAAAVTARQDNFKAIKEANDAMKAEAEKDAPDVALFQAQAPVLLDHVTRIGDHFPAGSGPESGLETDALPIIWEDQAGFATAASNMTASAQQFVATVATGDVPAIRSGLTEMGETCRTCHNTYRQKN